MADLEEFIRLEREAVEATPDDHPQRARRLDNLGVGLSTRYSRTGTLDDLEEAISYYQLALRHVTSRLIDRVKAGQHALQNCVLASHWQQAYEASNIAIQLVPLLTARSLENLDKQYMLGQVAGFASDAAAVALHAEKGPLVALKLLEQGRGVLAASLEGLRVDVFNLRESCPELAEQFIRLRDKLELPLSPQISSREQSRELGLHARMDSRYDADKELNALITEIRKQPGFEEFLLTPRKSEMLDAAKCGPIVVVNVSRHRSDAILVEEHDIRSLALSDLNITQIDQFAQKNDHKVLEWLWDTIMNPILNALGFTQSPSAGNWPHVWWIPTGLLSTFPLHAAGRHGDRSAQTVLDRVISSYSTSIKAIIDGRQRRISDFTQSARPQALLVAMQDTPRQSALPSAKEEVVMLRSLCKSMGWDPVEPGRRKSDITSHLSSCKIFHFAGHGHTDDQDPSQSHLLLEDWETERLTVANLLQMNIREHSPFLAYLSACGTGRIKDGRYFDESIHLISACQLAGFRHVIGTLWDVDDNLCVEMARITYTEMGDRGMTDESVCRGLHKATRELRDRWLLTQPRASREGRLAEETYVKHEGETRSAQDQGPRDARMPWKRVKSEPLHWVPYVHFGI